MKKHDSKATKRKGSEKKSIPAQLIAVIAVIAAAALFFLWHQSNFKKNSVGDILLQQSESDEISVPVPSTNTQASHEQKDSSVPNGTDTIAASAIKSGKPTSPLTSDLEKIEEQPVPPDPVTASGGDISNQVNQQYGKTVGIITDNGEEQSGSHQEKDTPLALICSKSARTIKEFYQHLDQQSYIQTYTISPNSEVYFTQLIQRLLDNPPVVSGETDDLYTILQNTAHFFRIIGKDNILLLKAILDMEKDQFEDVLADFYTLIHIPTCPENSFGLRVQKDALYNYAGFFLNTMGGRLYLFRRDSKSRMVVSYYSILLIDKANKNASNKHGIELKKAIDQLIDEMEATANTLKLKDMYLDRLYDLKEAYQ